MIRDLISDFLWDRRYARLEREADRLRRNRLRCPAIVWATGTWPVWSFGVDRRLAEIAEEQAVMLGFEAMPEPESKTVH